MIYILGGVVAVFVVLLLVAAVTGRLRVSACCAVADPAKDLRMRAAFDDDRSTRRR